MCRIGRIRVTSERNDRGIYCRSHELASQETRKPRRNQFYDFFLFFCRFLVPPLLTIEIITNVCLVGVRLGAWPCCALLGARRGNVVSLETLVAIRTVNDARLWRCFIAVCVCVCDCVAWVRVIISRMRQSQAGCLLERVVAYER